MKEKKSSEDKATKEEEKEKEKEKDKDKENPAGEERNFSILRQYIKSSEI